MIIDWLLGWSKKHPAVITQMLHVWHIYQHLPHKWPSFVGKSTPGVVRSPSAGRLGAAAWLGRAALEHLERARGSSPHVQDGVLK